MIRLTPIRLARAIALAALIAPACAAAQTAPDADGGLSGGPPVAGVCVLGREAVLAGSKIGQAASARLQQLTSQAQAEVDLVRTPLEAEIKALETQKATLSPVQYQARAKALQERWGSMQAKADLRTREMEATRVHALSTVASDAQPIVADVYRARQCGILFAREAMLGGNPAADLTPAVIAALDAKVTTISFDRVTLAPSAGGGGQ